MVAIDATFLMLFVQPDAALRHRVSGNPVAHAGARVEHLIETLARAHMQVLIPTPALSEVLVRVGVEQSQAFVDQIQRQAVFRLESFDVRAAVEVAAMTRSEARAGRKRGDSDSTWAKVKYDRQIVAIAKVNQVARIFSDDGDIHALATRAGIEVVGLSGLPLPPDKEQPELPFEES